MTLFGPKLASHPFSLVGTDCGTQDNMVLPDDFNERRLASQR